MSFFDDAEDSSAPALPELPAPTLSAAGPRRAPSASTAALAAGTLRGFRAGHIAGAEEDRWCAFFCAALHGAQTAEGASNAATVADVAYACLAQRRNLTVTGGKSQ